MTRRILAASKTFVWICAASLAAVMASERVYWYWSGIDADSLSVLAIFYATATATAFWVLSRVPGTGLKLAILGGVAYALVVEGIVTPVMYEDGPLPVLFLMFVGWHGLLAFAGFVYLLRRWALLGRARTIAVMASLTGIWWGVWALSSAVTDREAAEEFVLEGGSAEILTPGSFAVYAGWVGVVLVAAHLVMDRAWPPIGWKPSRAGRISIALAAVALAALLVLPVVPWAPLKLAVLAWATRLALRRVAASDGTPTVIDELAGRVRARHLLPVLMLPVSASAVYAAMWPAREHDSLSVVYWSMVGLQVVAGVGGLVWAVTRQPGGREATAPYTTRPSH